METSYRILGYITLILVIHKTCYYNVHYLVHVYQQHTSIYNHDPWLTILKHSIIVLYLIFCQKGK